MKIIVTGSLGNISKPLTEGLIQKGHEVVVISSNPEKQKDIETLGAIPAIGSLEDVDFLTKTFTDADAVYAMVPPNFKEFNSNEYYKIIGENYKLAIENSKVNRVVFLSSWGAHLDKGTGTILGSHHVEQILNQLENVHKTYLRPCSIYYNLLHYAEMIKNAGIIGTNFKNEDKIVWVHPNDIAEVAVEELTKITSEKLNIRYVASDEVTANETAKILGKAIGNPNLNWVSFTDEQVKNTLLEQGLPERFAQDLVDLNASISSGKMGEDYEKNKPKFGKVKLTDFAKEFANVYNQKS